MKLKEGHLSDEFLNGAGYKKSGKEVASRLEHKIEWKSRNKKILYWQIFLKGGKNG